MKQKICKSVDGIDLYYIINQINNAPFIIFIHGAGSNHTVYKPFFSACEKRNFIALDIRNHGKSGRTSLDTVTIKNITKDIASILANEHIHDVILIGNSLGASVALEFYKNNRKKVHKMVLFTLFSKRYIRYSSFLRALATVVYVFVRPISGWRRLKFQDYHKYQKRPIWYYPYLDIRGTPFGTVMKLVRELFATPVYLSTVTIPTQIFLSTADWSTKNDLIKSDCKTNAFLTVVEMDANHVVLTREHEDVLKKVSAFLAD